MTIFVFLHQERSFRPSETDDEAIFSFESFRKKNGTELTPKQALQVAEIVPKNMILFKFDPYIFTGGQVINVTSFLVFHTKVTVNSGLKEVIRMGASILLKRCPCYKHEQGNGLWHASGPVRSNLPPITLMGDELLYKHADEKLGIQ